MSGGARPPPSTAAHGRRSSRRSSHWGRMRRSTRWLRQRKPETPRKHTATKGFFLRHLMHTNCSGVGPLRIEGLLARPNPCYPLMNKPAVPALQRETLRPRQTTEQGPHDRPPPRPLPPGLGSEGAGKGHAAASLGPAPPPPEVLRAEIQPPGPRGGGGDTFPGPVVTTLHFLVMPSAPLLQQEAAPEFPGLHAEHRRSRRASAWKLDSLGHRWHGLGLTGLGPGQSPGWDPEGGHTSRPTTLVPVLSRLSVPKTLIPLIRNPDGH